MNDKSLILIIPIVGILLFFLLFIYSSTKYPGGSLIHPDKEGFDWIHNYWCDLMSTESYTLQHNPARPSAILGWTSICISILIIFWKSIEVFFSKSKWQMLFKTTSVLAMGIGYLAFTDYHDIIVAICFPFGTVTAIALTIGLMKSKMTFYKRSIWFILFLLLVSFGLYFMSLGLEYLGLIQKITIFVTLLWLIGFYISLFQLHNENYKIDQ